MAYSVQHVRFTLECAACGLVEKRDLDASKEAEGTHGWSEVRTRWRSYFCCPGCLKDLGAVLNKKSLAEQEATKAAEADCAHDYRSRGFLMQCAKCGLFKP
jgi:uncharacterized Zn finger protein